MFLTRLRQDAYLQIKEGYVDSGAAPGKDTRWQEVAQLQPIKTTKARHLALAARNCKSRCQEDYGQCKLAQFVSIDCHHHPHPERIMHIAKRRA